jgi:flagellar hook-basal body complex protein FliE
MSIPIQPIQPPPLASVPAPTPSGPAAQGSGLFEDLLSQASSNVQDLQQKADTAVTRFLNGQGGEVHQVALAVHRSEIAMETFVQIRNKLISAYQEVMRMQI